MPTTTTEVVAVVCLLCMFVLSGIHKLLHFDSTVSNLANKVPWWPNPYASILATIFLEVVCPFIIVYSMFDSDFEMASTASIVALLLFTITVTFIYHPLKLTSTYMKNIPFFSNLSVIGGLTLLLLAQK